MSPHTCIYGPIKSMLSNKQVLYEMECRHGEMFQVGGFNTCYSAIVLTGHALRRLDLSNMTHHRPVVRGDNITR